MKQSSLARHALQGAFFAAALCAAAVPALAQNSARKAGDPSRWYQGARTEQQRLGVLKKEIHAAYAQQQAECRRQAAGSRASCLKEARQVYRNDMANASRLVAEAPTSQVREQVTPVYGAGATAMGSSSAGATGSGSDMPQSGQSQSQSQSTQSQSMQTQSSQSQSTQPLRGDQPPREQPPVER